MKLGIRGQLTDIITCVKFLVDRLRGYGVLTPRKLPFPIDLLRRPYNSVALSCDTDVLGYRFRNKVQPLPNPKSNTNVCSTKRHRSKVQHSVIYI